MPRERACAMRIERGSIAVVRVNSQDLRSRAGLDSTSRLYSLGIMEKEIVISALAALAQETRLDIYRALVQAGPDGLPAGAIGTVLEIPSATLSFHLKELRSSGLIRCERQGRSRIYSPDFSAVNDLLAYLTANCCRGVDGEASATDSCELDGGTNEC